MARLHEAIEDTDKNIRKQEKHGEREQEEIPEVHCRCKEAKGKSVVQLLKQMVKDLTFWDKAR